ncbi:MAG TPA: SDR family oxidoreductase [Acidimicrobiales bacterium]|nr:SDR family oxidoreductase [Acidimicrobiales bacterium]
MAAISPYAASKYALGGFTEAAAMHYGDVGITCNAICPGFVDTPSRHDRRLEAATAAGMSYEEFLGHVVENTRTKQLTTVDQVVAVATLLASEAGGGITGVLWSVDGGIASW